MLFQTSHGGDKRVRKYWLMFRQFAVHIGHSRSEGFLQVLRLHKSLHGWLAENGPYFEDIGKPSFAL